MGHGKKWAIALHAGAGSASRGMYSEHHELGLKSALDIAQSVLVSGKTIPWNNHGIQTPSRALLTALAAVECLELNPLFNAGRGSSLTYDGNCELEASVMDGESMNTGAVCGLTTVKHPARLAAVVYSHAAYQFLGFSAAERYADRFPTLVDRVTNEWFVAETRKESLRKYKEKHADRDKRTWERDHRQGERSGETVGAAVADGHGNVAVVTSTGGTTGKWPGRIGDTPMVGLGSYASNASCAVSGTGIGEHFIRFAGASRLCFAMEYGGMSIQDAMSEVVTKSFPNDVGGFVGVTPAGEVCMEFNSNMMFRGCRNWQGMDFVRIWE